MPGGKDRAAPAPQHPGGARLPSPWPKGTHPSGEEKAAAEGPSPHLDGPPAMTASGIPARPEAVRAPAAGRRRLLGLGAGVLAGAVLNGCGFRPLYMPTASGKPGVAQRELAAVNVGLIPERPGQLLRQALQDRMGSDAGGPHRYDLRVVFWITGEGVGLQSDSTVTRIRLFGNANWTLLAQDPAHTKLTSGSARSLDGLNIFNSDYFAQDLENEVAQKRIAEAVAQEMITQLAVWFRNRDTRVG
jgi:LPS-assembly lipoprotein